MNADIDKARACKGLIIRDDGFIEVPTVVSQLLKLGQPVVPVGENPKTGKRKVALIRWKEFQSRAPSVEEVKQWIQNLNYDILGWGRITGAFAGVIVLDFDEAGVQWLETWGLKPHIRTRRGYHWVARHPGWPVKSVNFGGDRDTATPYPGVDIRADGGLSVVCGYEDRGGYTWLRGLEEIDDLELLPLEVQTFFGLDTPQKKKPQSAESKRASTSISSEGSNPESLVQWALAQVDAGHHRNETGFQLARKFRDNHYTEEEALEFGRAYVEQVRQVDNEGNADPYDFDEYRDSVRSAYSWSPQEPWNNENMAGVISIEKDDQYPGDDPAPEGKRQATPRPFSISPLKVPKPYKLTDSGVWKQTEDSNKPISLAAVWIGGRATDVNTGEVRLKLCWRRGDQTLERFVPREQALNQHKLVQLASHDFPVTGVNARDLVVYLDAFEALNRDALPHERISSRPGWQGPEGAEGFLWGEQHLTPKGDVAEDGDPNRITFAPISPGDEQAVEGMRSEGSLEAWIDAANRAAAHPVVQVILCASFAAPILRILGAPNFCINLGSITTGGKTTVMRVAASVWGSPNEMEPDGLVSMWDCTTVGVERIAALRNGIPLILDDTARIAGANTNRVSEVVYLVSSGRGKTRGAIKGMADTDTFRTILFSTGEAPLRSFGRGKGGAVMRTLEIPLLPFGGKNHSLGTFVAELNQEVLNNYGYAGPIFVAYVLKNQNRWSEWVAYYRERQQHYRSVTSAEEGLRVVDYVATIETAARIARELFEVNWLAEGVCEGCWSSIVSSLRDPTDAERALQIIYSWAQSNERTFTDRSDNVFVTKFSGRWLKEDWEHIAFYPDVLEDILRRHQFIPEVVLGMFKTRGWLLLGKSEQNRLQTKERVIRGSSSERVYKIARTALEEVGLLDDIIDPEKTSTQVKTGAK